MPLESRVEELEHEGRKIMLTRGPFDLYAEVRCSSISDYLRNFESVRKFLEAGYDTKEIFGFRLRRRPRLDTFVAFMIDNLTIDDIRESAYVREDTSTSVDSVLVPFVMTSSQVKKVPITRSDFVFSDRSGILRGYLELSSSTDPEVWNNAIYSERGDVIRIGVGEPVSEVKLPLVKIYDLTNKSFAERLQSGRYKIS